MRIILDGMGGDNAPKEIVKGAVQASAKINHEIVIVGPEELIQKELSNYKYDPAKITIKHAPDVITNDDAPVKAVRSKKESSMVVGFNMLKNGEGDVFISAGSTGALLAGGLFIIGRIKGIDRPALASIYPILGNKASLLVDAGANAECKPGNLLQFGIMGDVYMQKVLGRENPRVGLVNIGAEEKKGNTLYKETYQLLAKSNVNFVGNVEAREVPHGACDVIVADGFTGNVILKLTEGLAWNILQQIKRKFTSSLKAKLGAGLLLDKINELKADFDYSEYGGAPILGIKGPVVKMHGSSEAKAVMNTIIKAVPYAEEKVVNIIESELTALLEKSLAEELGNLED